MHGYTMVPQQRDRLADLTSRFKVVGKKVEHLSEVHRMASDRCLSLRSQIQSLEDRVDLLSNVGDLLRVVFDRVIETETSFVTGTVTEGLRSVFHDQKLSLKSEFHVRANRVGIDLVLSREYDGGHTVEGDPTESFGGGPVSIISVLLRVVVLLKSGRVPFLLLDESVGAVAPAYRESCALFLRSLAEKLGVDILLVAHETGYEEVAHRFYSCTEVLQNNRPQFQAKVTAKNP